MNKQEEIDNFFKFERAKHFDFFLPYYQEKNWLVVEDNINGNKPISWDVQLEVFAGEYKLVDEKARKGDFDDCLIEILQDFNTLKEGWYYTKKDWVLYGSWGKPEARNPTSLYLIKMKLLHDFLENLNGYQSTLITKKGWGNTWNIKIFWKELLANGIAQSLILNDEYKEFTQKELF